MLQLRTLLGTLGLAPTLAALMVAQASAQEPSPGAPAPSGTEAPAVGDEVIVRGRRLEDIEADLRLHIRDFIGEVVVTPRGRGFARWHRNICVGVYNLETSAAQYIADRISSLALDVGLEPGEPGCQPDVNIVFATNAKEMAGQMVASDRRIFMPAGGYAGMDRGRIALEEFVETEKPVRWWHVSLPVGAHSRAAAFEVVKNCGELHCPPMLPVQGASRIHEGTVDELLYVIIVVDATRLKGKTWEQLGDYLAVLSLAQIDQNTDPVDFDSILNLFTNPAAYSGLTDWDRSYVRALYEFDQERKPKLQANEIISRIAEQELGAAE